MSGANQLMNIIELGKNVYGRWVFQRLVRRFIILAALVMVTSIMLTALLMVGFYTLYLALLGSINPPVQALVVTTVVFVIVTFLMGACAWTNFKKLRHSALASNPLKSPFAAYIGNTVGSFFEGLIAPERE